MTRDELIAALQKCPENVPVVIDDPEYGIPSVLGSIGLASPCEGPEIANKIVINLVGEQYVEGTGTIS